MLRIRFQRRGKKNQPFFRIVVIKSKSPVKGGRPLEVLGFFNPLTKKKNIKKERVNHWLSRGAQPSASVHNLLVREQIIKLKKISVHSTKKSKKKQKSESGDKEAKTSSLETGPNSTNYSKEKTEAEETPKPEKAQEVTKEQNPENNS